MRAVAQFGSALALGARGRGFESRQPDRGDRPAADHRLHPSPKPCTLRVGDRDPRGSPSARGRSSMVEPQSSKLATRVRFPSPAPTFPQVRGHGAPILGKHQDLLSLVPSLGPCAIMADLTLRADIPEQAHNSPIEHRPPAPNCTSPVNRRALDSSSTLARERGRNRTSGANHVTPHLARQAATGRAAPEAVSDLKTSSGPQ